MPEKKATLGFWKKRKPGWRPARTLIFVINLVIDH